MQKARDSAVERAERLQTQLNEMHTDLEKLRKTSMLNLRERVGALNSTGCVHYHYLTALPK